MEFLFFILAALAIVVMIAWQNHVFSERRDTIRSYAAELAATRRKLIREAQFGLINFKKWNQAKRTFVMGHFSLSGRKEHAAQVNTWMAEIDLILDAYERSNAEPAVTNVGSERSSSDTIPMNLFDRDSHAETFALPGAEIESDAYGVGIVYLLQNPAMQGLLKIGRTSRDTDARVRELNRATGVPMPFDKVYEVSVADSVAAERFVHEALAKFRENNSREFFRVSSKIAIDTMLEAKARYPLSK